MIRKTLPLVSAAANLLESDARYFELAAEHLELSAGELVFVRDLICLPAACVLQRVNESLTGFALEQSIAELEETCRTLGAPLARLYVHAPTDDLSAALAAAGYRSKVEIGFLAEPCPAPRSLPRVQLRPVVSAADWRDKQCVHQQEDVGPDGYCNHAAAWTELMRRKNETGEKHSFLIEVAGSVAGAIALVEMPTLWRLKNLFVLPEFRGQGLAAAAVRELLDRAPGEGISTLGVFGIAGSPGCGVYTQCGFQEATRQVEFTRRIVPAASPPLPRYPR